MEGYTKELAERAAAGGDVPAVLAHTAEAVIKLLGSEDIDRCNGELPALRAKLDAAIGEQHL